MGKARLLLAAIFLFLSSSVLYSQDSTVTFVEEFIPGSKAFGFGGSLVVQARDPSSIFWNPALLTGLHDRSLLISINKAFSFDYVGFTQFVPLYGTLGAAVSRVETPTETVDRGTIAWGRKLARRFSVGANVNIQKHRNLWFADGGVGFLIGNAQVGTLDNHWRAYDRSRLLDRWNFGLTIMHIPLSDKLFEPSAQFGMSYLIPALGLLFNSGYDINKSGDTSHLGAGFEFNRNITVFTGIEDIDVENWGIGMSYTHDNFIFNFSYYRQLSRILLTLSARISPAPVELAFPHYRRASNNFKAKKFKTAARQYRQFLSYEIRSAQSDTAFHRVQALNKKLARDKIMVDSLYVMTSRILAQGSTQYLRAAVILGKILEMDPDNLKAKAKLASLQNHIDKFVKRSLADGIYEFQTEHYFKSKGAFNRVLLFDQDHRVALRYKARIDTILTDLGEEYFYRGVGYFRQKNYKWAKEEFVRALKYSPSHKEARSYLQRTLQRVDESRRVVADLIQEGQVLERRNRYSAAVNKYLEVLKIDEDNELVKSRLAVLRPKIEKFVSRKYNEGLRYLRAHEYSRAQNAFQTVLSIDPRHRNAKRQLIELRNEKKQKVTGLMSQAETAFQNEQWRTALEMYSQVLQLNSKNNKAMTGKAEAQKKLEINQLLQQGRSHFNQENFKEAEKVFLRILSLDPSHRVAKIELDATKTKIDELVEQYFSDGINLYTLDRYQDAIALWNKALKLKPDHKGSIDYKKQATDRLEALKKLK
ncbi:MAG: tetratricopeptide repeat protein [bacterium]